MLKSTNIINHACLKITFTAMVTFVSLTLNLMVAADHRAIVEEVAETIPKTITDTVPHQAQSKYGQTAEIEKLKSASPRIVVYYPSTDNEALLLDSQEDIGGIYQVNSDYIWGTQTQVRIQFNPRFYRELDNGTEQSLPWHKPVPTRASIHY